MEYSQFNDFNHFKTTMGLNSKDACLLLLKEIEKLKPEGKTIEK